jgi:gamma-glutamyltranspeptidase / glutathione hydrolase
LLRGVVIYHRMFIAIYLALALSSCRHGGMSVTPPTTATSITRASEAQVSHPELYEAHGKKFVVATQGLAASRAAKAVIEAGGNIIDAAIATSFVISVERPHSTGIGGGGFMLYREAKMGKVYAIDFRERAPLKATKEMYLDVEGNVNSRQLSLDGALSVGVPGMVAGLLEVHQKFGRLKRDRVLQAAIDLAENGFPVYPDLAEALQERQDVLLKFAKSKEIFLKGDKPYQVGHILKQSDLAQTLKAIAQKGRAAFYEGPIARVLVDEVRNSGGIISLADLKKYKVHWRMPVQGTFHDYTVYSMPPPSSGGTHVIEILNIVEGDSLRKFGAHSPETIHLTASAMQQAFQDRAAYMGDPDFVKNLPIKQLLDKSYARLVRGQISLEKARPSSAVKPGQFHNESTDTTNFSMMDGDGNVVVSTQTINGSMGSGMVAGSTGILLNNEMDDFAAKPGAANLFGAIGGTANLIQPGKTPLSSMAPTIVFKNGSPVLALGAPGGTRIITCVAQTILNHLEYGFSLYDSIAAVRFHHQWRPDQLDIEAPGPGKSITDKLSSMGYIIKIDGVPCRVNAVANQGGELTAVADPRDLGLSLGW